MVATVQHAPYDFWISSNGLCTLNNGPLNIAVPKLPERLPKIVLRQATREGDLLAAHPISLGLRSTTRQILRRGASVAPDTRTCEMRIACSCCTEMYSLPEHKTKRRTLRTQHHASVRDFFESISSVGCILCPRSACKPERDHRQNCRTSQPREPSKT